MLLRRVARPLLAGVFIADGVSTLMNPDPRIKAAAPLLDKGERALPTDKHAEPAQVVQADAAIKVGAGILLSTGKAPRLAAAVLAAGLIPNTVVTHPFWAAASDEEKKHQRLHFAKNAGLLGGLMLASADTHGKPSLAYRTKRSAKKAEKAARKRVDSAASQVSDWKDTAADAVPLTR